MTDETKPVAPAAVPQAPAPVATPVAPTTPATPAKSEAAAPKVA